MQRRVGQHHAELARPGRDRVRDRRAGRARREHDRALRRGEQLALRSPSVTSEPAAAIEPTISANGLSSRCLRARSAATAALVVGAAGEMEPADALDGDDRAVAQRRMRPPRIAIARRAGRQRSPAPSSSATDGPQCGHAFGWAWKRRSRGSSYSAWQRAHIANAGHRRQRAVVGDAADDREARAAVGAVGERVAEAPVVGVEELAQALLAGRAVGRDRRVGGAVARRSRGSRSRGARRLALLDHDALEHGERRRVGRQAREEPGDRRAARPRPRAPPRGSR